MTPKLDQSVPIRYIKKGIENTSLYYYLKAITSDIYISEANIWPLNPVYISPDDVLRHSPVRFSRKKNIGDILKGDWDLLKSDLEHPRWCEDALNNHLLYKAMVRRYRAGVPWDETEFVQKVRQDVDQYGKGWYGKCKSQEMVNEQCERVDNLYDSIKTEGYTFGNYTEGSVSTAQYLKRQFFEDTFHEITVNINRYGEYLFNGDGRHRLFISKILGLNRIPVLVVVYHWDWYLSKYIEGTN